MRSCVRACVNTHASPVCGRGSQTNDIALIDTEHTKTFSSQHWGACTLMYRDKSMSNLQFDFLERWTLLIMRRLTAFSFWFPGCNFVVHSPKAHMPLGSLPPLSIIPSHHSDEVLYSDTCDQSRPTFPKAAFPSSKPAPMSP
jgi:hypothetical protein